MKKILSILFLLLMSISVVACGSKKLDTSSKDQGQIEEEKVEQKQEHEQDIEKIFLETKRTEHYSDEEIRGWYEFTYDKNGNKTDEKHYDGEDGELKWWYQWEYDTNNMLVRETWLIDNGKTDGCYWEIECDSNGNVIKGLGYASDGTFVRTVENLYDQNGNRIKHISYTAEGEYYPIQEFEYDKYNNMIKNIYLDENGNVASSEQFEYEYDKNGNKVEMKSSTGIRHRYEYDNNNNLVKEIQYERTGLIDFWIEYEYMSFVK